MQDDLSPFEAVPLAEVTSRSDDADCADGSDRANKLGGSGPIFEQIARLQAKRELQQYCFTLLGIKFEEGRDQSNYIDDAAEEVLEWLENNPLTEKNEFQAKQRQLERIFNT